MMKRWVRALREARESERLLDIPEWQRHIVHQIQPFTMTSIARIVATIGAVEYVVRQGIPGAIVECGVWKGGQVMAAALALKWLKEDRHLFLYDTFEGMTAPGDLDRDLEGAFAHTEYLVTSARSVGNRWCEARLEEVQRNMALTGYPIELVHYVVGPVEETIPQVVPETISYLRLDTDWYASTMHELVHLYPKVAKGGVVAIDDYGHWEGSKKAADEYMESHRVAALLHRIDYSARQFIKP